MVAWLEPGTAPDPRQADENGLVALGGSLAAQDLLRAYRVGVFPWSSRPVLNWWSPDPRAIFDLATYRPPRTVRRSVARAGWRFTIDEDFPAVIRACAEPGKGRAHTWITPDFVKAYEHLFRLGHAHSVEVREGEALVGGIYGVAIGGFFGGESMFHRRTDASKAALAHLVERLRAGGFKLFDAQVQNPHLERLGAIEIPREEFLSRLEAALRVEARLAP